MRYLLTFKIVIDVLRAYKVRTALAVTGVLLGTFAVILVTSLTASLEKKVREEIDKFGENTLTVVAGKVRRRASAQVIYQSTSLKPSDLRDIRDEVNGVKAAEAFTMRTALVTYSGTTISTSATGVTPDGFRLKNLVIENGGMFTDADNRNMARVCVIGSEVKTKLFGNTDPVGRTILIYRVPFIVTGVLEPMGTDLTGASLDDVLVMPLNTHMKRITNVDYVDGIMVQMYRYEDEAQVTAGTQNVLRRNHKITKGKEDDFDIISPSDMMEMRTKALNIVSFLGNITAAVSYLIGGLGIFSIMLLIVGQRRQEVGIRRAVGARRRDIMRQFLGESAFIGLSGGFLGGALGFLVCYAVFATGKLPFAFSSSGGIAAFVSSLFIGVVAGAYPASMAAKVKPVDALKS
ncbi:MAG: ABC transporter permease [Deferribacterales bacterium]